ncbi:MAG: amino acid racemase [Halanaerobiales bacterium]|nr:amino acid racemase [Halanaerobiales bacterium]
MKRIGLIGAKGWCSPSLYYNKINRYFNQIRGNKINPETIIYTVNYQEIIKFQKEGDWNALADFLIPKAIKIEEAGADFLVITSNTVHKIIDKIQAKINIPIINIIDVVGKKAKYSWCKKPGLLANKYLIKDGFYQKKLEEKYVERIILPAESEIEELNYIIIDELANKSNTHFSSRLYINNIINNLVNSGVDSIILASIELTSLIDIIADSDVKILNSLELHVQEIVHYTLKKSL